MKTVIQTVEFINSEYKGIQYERIIPCNDEYDIKRNTNVGEFTEGGYRLKVISVRVIEDFLPLEYAKITKPIQFNNLEGS